MEPEKSSANDLLKLKKFNAYILIFDTIQQWQNWLSKIYHHWNWNPAAKFSAIFKEDVINMTEVFKICWLYNLVDFNLHYDNKVYTYFPYNSSNCTINFNAVKIHTCGEEIKNIFPNKIPKTLNGCEIKLLGNTIPPYVINVLANRNNPNKAGFETTMLHTISKKLNFTDTYIKHTFKIWGNRLPNGTYTDMFSALIDKSADLMFGMADITLDSVELDTVTLHIHDELIWWVPIAGQEPVWRNFLKIYKPFMWLSVLLAVILNSSIWWIISKILTQNKFNFINSLLITICSFLQLTVVPPSSASLRCLFIFWVAFTLILATAYQSQLISILTQPRYEHQISSIEELINSKLKFGFYTPVSSFYTNPNSSIESYIYNNYIACPLTEECLNRSAFKRDFAVAKNKRQTYYLMKKYYSYPDGRPMLFGFGNGMKIRPRVIVQRGYPLLKLFNPLIVRLKESGIINYWDYEFTHARKVPVKSVHFPLTISHLQYGFLSLGFGLCFSVLVFFGEVLWNLIH